MVGEIMKIIGLTGGIGSGKSTVSRFLAELGAAIIDADNVGHEVLKPGTRLYHEVAAIFGRDILKADGEIDRQKLGEMAFGNPELLSQLNKMMHPRIDEIVKARLEDYKKGGAEVIVLEATLLVEGKGDLYSLVDEIWVTTASEATVLRRLKKQRQLSEQESLSRIRSQPFPGERMRYADVVIDTECNLSELKARVRQLWDKLEVKEGSV
jgi:dephospho-CoA kinase